MKIVLSVWKACLKSRAGTRFEVSFSVSATSIISITLRVPASEPGINQYFLLKNGHSASANTTRRHDSRQHDRLTDLRIHGPRERADEEIRSRNSCTWGSAISTDKPARHSICEQPFLFLHGSRQAKSSRDRTNFCWHQ